MSLLRKQEVPKCTLAEWVCEHPSEEDLRDVFVNMDIALKYIHEHGYCVEVFHPKAISVLYDRSDYIQFDRLIELSQDSSFQKQEIKEDIFNSAFVQVGIYTNTLKSLTPQTLRENFDDFARFLPEGDVPYYRGVVQRGASVYFSEFVLEKTNRDLDTLEKQLQETDGGRAFQKSNGHYIPEQSSNHATALSNDAINDDIYKQINGLKEVAFVNYLLVPTIVLISLVLIAFVGWVFSLF